MCMCVSLYIETRDGIEERVKTHLHSSTRRLIHMEAIESVSKKLTISIQFLFTFSIASILQ